MYSAKKKVKIGLLGAGGVVKDMHLPVLVNMPDVNILWICDKDKQRGHELGNLFNIPNIYHSIEDCIDVDIVLVAIPVGYRIEVMEYIFKRGWHAFCEKPFAITHAEHERYLSDARLHSVQVGVGLVRRYGPASLAASKIIAKGCFGPIKEVWANEGFRLKRTGKNSSWYVGDSKVVGGGVLMETGSHLIDQICTILDLSSFEIETCAQRKYANLDFETKFKGVISTRQQSDIPISVEISWLEDLCNGIFIQFQSFIMKCGLFFQDHLTLIAPDGKTIARFETNEGARTLGQALFLEWRDFIDQCSTGNSSFVSADTAIQSTAIIQECYQIVGDRDLSKNGMRTIDNA